MTGKESGITPTILDKRMSGPFCVLDNACVAFALSHDDGVVLL